MKSKLLQGIIKDLMKYPMDPKGAEKAMKPKGAAHVTIEIGKGGHDEDGESMGDEASEDAMGEQEPMGLEDPAHAKKLAMSKAIHAKMHK